MRPSLLLVLPLLVCLGGAALAQLCPRQAWPRRAVALVAMAAITTAGALLLVEVRREGVLALQVGGWTAPFGITLVADLLSAIMVLVTGVMGLTVVLYSGATLAP